MTSPPSPGQPRWVVGRCAALAAPRHVLGWAASCKYCRLPPVLHASLVLAAPPPNPGCLQVLFSQFGYGVEAFAKVCTTLPGVEYTYPTETCDRSGCSGGSGGASRGAPDGQRWASAWCCVGGRTLNAHSLVCLHPIPAHACIHTKLRRCCSLRTGRFFGRLQQWSCRPGPLHPGCARQRPGGFRPRCPRPRRPCRYSLTWPHASSSSAAQLPWLPAS